MTNALVGYMIGKYYADHGSFVDMNDLFMKGMSLDDFRTREVERFLAIQQFVDKQDMSRNKAFAALQIQLLGLFNHLPDEELPFYFLPLAYLRGATLSEVLTLTTDLVTNLTKNQLVIDEVMCIVELIKWSLTTLCSYFPLVHRCFSNMESDDSLMPNLVREALAAHQAVDLTSAPRSEIRLLTELRHACSERTHAAMRCALVYALSEAYAPGEYSPSMALGTEFTDQKGRNSSTSIKEDFSVSLPLRSRLTTHVDTHVVGGYYRLDGYVAWQLKAQKEPLLDIAILGDKNGPDREVLRFWNFCNKHLDWEELSGKVDGFFSLRPYLRINWRRMLKGHEIQWYRKRVAFQLKNERFLSFVPDYKHKTFVLDKEEAKNAGISKFHFAPNPAIEVLENLSESLMSDD